jgi:polyferredoxin
VDLMSGNGLLQKIPVVVESPQGAVRQSGTGKDIHWKRITTQTLFIALLILIPITGLFRIDVSSGFVILGRQIWFSDFFLVFGFWLSLACLMVLLYSTIGTAFCGWACPQNTLSSWANKLTLRSLGKRAVIDWDSWDKSRVSSGKNKLVNWLVLGGQLLAVSMVFSLIPLLYFYTPGAVWSFITLQHDARLSGSLHWVYTLFVFMALVNLAVMRYYVCRYMCIYRIWQFLFKTKQTLHVEYDATRAEECTKCRYCLTVCPVGIDPRDTATYDSCTNCGACITACSSLHEKDKVSGLLTFKFGERPGLNKHSSQHLATLAQRARWVLPAFLIGVSLFAWGIWTYQPYNLSAFRAETYHSAQIQDYHIDVANKLYAPGTVQLQVKGLPEGSYALSTRRIAFSTAGRENVYLHVNDNLPPGIYPVTISAQSDGGWHGTFRIEHVAINKDRS